MRVKEFESAHWKSKFSVVGRDGVVLQVEVEINGEIIEVLSSFKYL